MKIISRQLLTLAALVLCTGILFSCSKKNNNPDTPSVPGIEGHTAKFTITVTGPITSNMNSIISAAVFGQDAKNLSNSTIWKVNGTTKNNEDLVQFFGNDFLGNTKTYVVESLTPVMALGASLSFDNFDNSAPYKISFKAEIDGKVVTNDKDITITGTSGYSHNYSY